MVLKRTKNEVRAALASNIMETCRQVLPDIEEIFVEGLLGVTLNRREIFLVNLSDLYSKEEPGPPAKRKRGRRSGISSEFRRDYVMDESFDGDETSSKRSSGSFAMGLVADFNEQQAQNEAQDMSTHYIKEEDMISPDYYGVPKVGRPPKQNFPELEDVSATNSPIKTPCVRLLKMESLADEPKLLEEPVLDLSIDKRNSLSSPNLSTTVSLLTASPSNDENVMNNAIKSRRKRGRPRKISDDSIKSTEIQMMAVNAYGGPAAANHMLYQPINQSGINLNSETQPLDAYSDQPQDFSTKSIKLETSGTALDLNMNSALNTDCHNTSYDPETNAEIPIALVTNSNNHNSSILQQDSIDQSESWSNSQSESFVRISQESNQSEEGVMSPGQSENSFQSGPVFPHLEEYDGVPFNSSIEDSFNDSSVDPTSANESLQEDDDKIELTSTGRPKRKTSMSPWVRQFFNITTGGGESKTVQIKATQACPICQKVFSAGSHLKRHYLVTHTNSSKFQCQVCTKRFGSADHLKRHMGTHAEEKKFKCHLCSRRFNVKYRLTEHLADKHSIKDISKELQVAIDNQNEADAMVTNHDDDSMDVNESFDHGNVSVEGSTFPT